MANYGVQKSTATGVLSWYEDQDFVKFSIFRGSKENDAYLTFSFNGSNKEDGLIALNKALSDIEPTDYNSYFLKLYGNGTTKKAVAAPGITFQLYTAAQNIGYIPRQSGLNDQVATEILNEIRALRAERLQQQTEDEEEEEEQQEPNILAGIVNSPQMQNMLINVFSNLFTNNVQGQQPRPTALAGIEDDNDLKTAVNTLLNKGVTVADIQKLAAMSEGQLSMLLSMLRK